MSTPSLSIVLVHEAAPVVRLFAESFEDEQAIRAWLASRAELAELVERACRLAEELRAA